MCSAAKDYRGAAREPRYAMCDCGAMLGFVPREHEESPQFLEALVKGPSGRPDGHRATVLRRSQVRELVGDQTALEALETLAAHLAAMY